ncbi:flap endonuclease-1 [[Eubacterium] cellulosolvens]
MGVNLSDIVQSQKRSLEDFADKVVAVDAHNILYQFLANIRTQDGSMLMDSQGRPTSHLTGLFTRTSKLISIGIKPIYVFDGKPHKLKTQTLKTRQEIKEKAKIEYQMALETGDMDRARMKAAQSTYLTPEMIKDAQTLLENLGIPWLQAPSEGEAQACHMAKKGDVWAVVSQDFDSLLFGATRLVRNLTVSGRRKLPGRNIYVNIEPEFIDLQFVLTGLGITQDQLIDLSILVGTDFNPGIKGYGPKKALKAIREFKDLKTVVKEKQLELPDYDLVQKIFKEPEVMDEYVINWSAVDEEKVIEFLCDEHDFARERVVNTLESFQKFKGAVAQKSLDQWF